MKTTSKILSAAALVALSAVFTTACEKTDSGQDLSSLLGTSSNSAADDASEGPLMHIGGPHHRAALPLLGDCGLPENDSCFTYTVSGDDYPRVYTFTPTGKGPQPKDENVSETITLTVSNDMHLIGSKQTLLISRSGEKGTMTMGTVIETIATNDNGHTTFSVTESMAATGDRGDISREMTGTIELTAGIDTESCDDDIFVINSVGKMSFKKLLKTSEGSQVISDLTITKGCEFPLSGIITATGDKGDFSIDFGDGTCDEYATVTKDGETTTVDLSQKKGPRKGPGKQ